MLTSYIYPTNNFCHQNNVQYYYYKTYVIQGNNWANFGLHQIQLRNETNKVLEVESWNFKQGRVEEDFRVRQIQPGLFYTARVVPHSHYTADGVKGAIVCKFKGSKQYFTLAFQDGLYDLVDQSKGYIVQGNDWEKALLFLTDNSPKVQQWGSYEWKQVGTGRGRSVFTIGKSRF